MKTIEKICIIGVGGVGGYFGGMLAKSGICTTFVARGAHKAAIQKEGLTIKTDGSCQRVFPTKMVESLEQAGKQDLIILATKAHQLENATENLEKIVHKKSIIIPLQNGISSKEILSQRVDSGNIMSGFCRILAHRSSEGIVEISPQVKPTIIFGEAGGKTSQRAELLSEVLAKANIEFIFSKDIERAMWGKFMFICTGALTAITRCSYPLLAQIPQTRKILRDLICEVYTLGKARGVCLDEDMISRSMSSVERLDEDAIVSLRRDLDGGRESEIEFQNGAVVRLCKDLGIECPANEFAYGCVLAMEGRIENE